MLVNLMLASKAQAHVIQFEKREATFQLPVNGAAVGSARLVSDMAARSASIQPFPTQGSESVPRGMVQQARR